MCPTYILIRITVLSMELTECMQGWYYHNYTLPVLDCKHLRQCPVCLYMEVHYAL